MDFRLYDILFLKQIISRLGLGNTDWASGLQDLHDMLRVWS